MSKDKSVVDITSFNTVESSEHGEPMDLFYAGRETGLKLIVIGEHSDSVQRYLTERAKEFARKAKFAEKRGKELDSMLEFIEKTKDRDIENAMVRIIGWENGGEFDKEKLRRGLEKNPQWIEDVIEFSKDLGNFTKSA